MLTNLAIFAIGMLAGAAMILCIAALAGGSDDGIETDTEFL